MATGSGKTIVLIKLIEILDDLIASKLIPENDILILTHSDDLNIQEIKEKLGKYILSIDGTYSYRGKTLYIFRSYENGVVLYANTTEKDDAPHLQPLFEKVVEMYGLPMAVISDMQPAIIESVKNVMPGIPHQYCQYHFLKKFHGKGI